MADLNAAGIPVNSLPLKIRTIEVCDPNDPLVPKLIGILATDEFDPP